MTRYAPIGEGGAGNGTRDDGHAHPCLPACRKRCKALGAGLRLARQAGRVVSRARRRAAFLWPVRYLIERGQGVSRRTRRFRSRLRMRWVPLARRPARRALLPVAHATPAVPWTLHDENWTRIRHRWEHRRMLRDKRALVVADERPEAPAGVCVQADGAIRADVPANRPDRWVYAHIDPAGHLWRNFRWTFTARRDSEFRELQFGFRYVDFYNRYRFRQEGDYLCFDIVHNGAFTNAILAVPFRMDLGRDYRYAIDVYERRFVLSVDGTVRLDATDPRDLFPRGSIAVILWEKGREIPIRAGIQDVEVVET